MNSLLKLKKKKGNWKVICKLVKKYLPLRWFRTENPFKEQRQRRTCKNPMSDHSIQEMHIATVNDKVWVNRSLTNVNQGKPRERNPSSWAFEMYARCPWRQVCSPEPISTGRVSHSTMLLCLFIYFLIQADISTLGNKNTSCFDLHRSSIRNATAAKADPSKDAPSTPTHPPGREDVPNLP